MLAKKNHNALFWFVRDVEYIMIDTTPKNDGNDAYRIEIEDLFALYKQWHVDKSPEAAAFSQTLRFANEFSKDLAGYGTLLAMEQIPTLRGSLHVRETEYSHGRGIWYVGDWYESRQTHPY